MSDTRTNPSAQFEDDEIDLLALLRRLWAGKYWIAGVAVVALVIGAIIAVGTPATYRADALLQLEEKSGQLALPEALSDLSGSEPRSATEIEILRSRLVLGKAVADVHLDWQAKPKELPLALRALVKLGLPLPNFAGLAAFARGDEVLRLDLLEVPSFWLGEEMSLVAGDDGSFTITLPNGVARQGRVGETLMDQDLEFALRVGDLQAGPGREFSIKHLSDSAAINGLRGRLSVSERGRQTSILELGLTGADRQSVERELHAITQAYLRQNISRSAAEAQSSLTFVESQLPEAEAAVKKAEDALNQYRQEQQAIDLGFEGQSLLTQISSLESELQQLADQEDELSERYTPNHPVYQQLLNARARLESRLETLRSEVGGLPQTQRVVFNLTRDLELAQEVYVQLMNRAQELQVLKASTIGNVRIVDQARTAPLPVAPKRSRILALSLLLGLIAGAGGVLLRAWLRKGVHSSEEIEATGVPVFATINHLPEATAHRKSRSHLPIHAFTDSSNLAIEGFRSLRTALHFGLLDAGTRSIAITSAAPEAGKSFVAVNLAAVSVQADQKVCLVDADLRRGRLRRYFKVSKHQPGLSEYLAGEAELDDILVPSTYPGLMFLPTGQFPPNPSELFMRKRFAELLAELDRRFDLTIVDTPPALAVTDPVVIGRAVGATIMVARFDETPLGEVEAVQHQFATAGVKLSGAVLNGFDHRRADAGYGYGYGYSYRYTYKKSEVD